MTDDRKGAFSVIGVGAAACLACCAPLLLGFLGTLGTLGIAGVASALFIGVGGLVVAALAVAAFIVVRGRKATCATSYEPVPVAAPLRRLTTDPTATPTEPLLP